MKLSLQNFEIRDIILGDSSEYADGLLTINKAELISLIAKDKRITDLDIVVVKPGERTRISNILEISEPRVKPDNDSYFPGMLNPLYRAGRGKTNVLKGCSVLEIGVMPGFIGSMVDMAGEGATLTPFSKTYNVCILTKPAPRLKSVEYGFALKQAGLMTSVYLANLAKGKTPDETKIFDLCLSPGKLRGLPKVGYLFQLHSHGDSREPFIYGDNIRRYYPTIIHPNEILDGAIVCGHYNISPGLKNSTYSLLNHPVITDLYESHGREMNFRGVVIAPEPITLNEIKRTSMMSAALLKNILDVDAAIITKEGGGHTDVDLMRNCEECEKLGIKTVLIDNEWLGPDGAEELALLDMSPNADAIISVGNMDEVLDLPPMEKVVGGHTMPDIVGDLRDEVSIPIRCIANGMSQIGFTFLTTENR
jgi:sarcosine reductase